MTSLPPMVSGMSSELAYAIRRGIVAERSRLGWSQAQLAERLRWTRSRLANIETGQTSLALADLPEVCAALGVTLAVLAQAAPEGERRALGI